MEGDIGSGMLESSMDKKVRELLKEVQLKYESTTITKFIDDTVSAIREVIDQIHEVKVETSAVKGFVRDVGLNKAEFRFKKPKSVEIGGSYLIQSIAELNTGVDMIISLPKECFLEKDYLNHRYHAKRCLYLSVIRKYLSRSKKFGYIEWSTFQNEARKPVLLVYPVQEHAKIPGFFIRLIPTATSLFNVSKLNLTRNNIPTLNQVGVSQATPVYNSSILEDMFLEENAEFVRKTFLGWKELGEALILMKVWARNRPSIYAHDCLNGFLISVILSYLANECGGNRINRSMKAMQIFRVTLGFIATSNLWDKGIYLQPHSQSSLSEEERKRYWQSFPVLICDSSSQFNLASRFTRSSISELRDEAALTINCIDKKKDGGFEKVFMTIVDFPAKYDYCIRINLKEDKEVYVSGFCLDKECWRTYEEKVLFLLEQGLGDRAKSIRVTWRSGPSEWNIKQGFSEFGGLPLVIGISFSEKSFRVVDVGPNVVNKEEVLKYRKFWGEKVEQRRLEDGTFVESTEWKCKLWERHLIVKKITEYVLLRHLSVSIEDMTLFADQLDCCLLNGVEDSISFYGTLLAALEVLSKRLCALEDTSFRVSSVQPLDSAFRSTSVFPPEPHPLVNEKDCIQPLEVMIQLEGSRNWQMDVAIEKTKYEFLLKIGESLQKSWGMTCTGTAAEDGVDVFMSGYAFRLRILHVSGLSLVKNQVCKDQTKRVTSVDKELFIRGQHSSMIIGLLGRYPMYGAVVRIAKRWVSAHFFSAILTEEAVELLVAYLFLRPLPFYAPCSRITGFLRFLRMLSNYDWTSSPLIIDINGDMTLEDEKEVNENFMSSRKSYEENPHNLDCSMFLATSYDKTSEAWTKSSPNTSELRRISSYARSSAEFLTNLILQDQIDSQRWEGLWKTPLNQYDVVIHLVRDKLPYPQRLHELSKVMQGKHATEEMKMEPRVNFDLVRFVEDLKGEFPNMFKLWYDSFGGAVICLTWDRPVSKKRVREEDANEEKQDRINVLSKLNKMVGNGFVRSIEEPRNAVV